MQDYNAITLVGSVAKYVDVLKDPQGQPICEVTLAGSQQITGSNGKPRTLTWYHRFFLPQQDPAWVARTYHKGRVVRGQGSLHTFRDVRDDQARTEVVVKASATYAVEASPEELLLDRYGNPRLNGATNVLCVVGTLARKPEIKTASNGNPYCFFSVFMHTSSLFEREGTSKVLQELQVACWGEFAEAMAAFELGERILVTGTLVHERWQGPEGEQLKMSRILSDGVLRGKDFDDFLEEVQKYARLAAEKAAEESESAAGTSPEGERTAVNQSPAAGLAEQD